MNCVFASQLQSSSYFLFVSESRYQCGYYNSALVLFVSGIFCLLSTVLSASALL